MTFKPVIKWSGSKRSQCDRIVSHIPDKIETYYEPFCGSSSVLRALLESDICVDKFVCSDINKDLIELWNDIKHHPDNLIMDYTHMWDELNNDVNISRKKEYYNNVRDRFNKHHSTSDFFFILRTCVNGLVRYNTHGNFNTSFHLTRNGIKPATISGIMSEWSELLNTHDVQFIHISYNEIIPSDNDFVYVDPPYYNTSGMYYNTFNHDELWDWLIKQNCGYLVSFDGVSDKDNTYNVPKQLYDDHMYIDSGGSSFRRLKHVNVNVKESIYVKYSRQMV